MMPSNQTKAVALTLPQYLSLTRPKSNTIATAYPAVDNGTSTIPMPQSGCLVNLLLRFNISVTIAGTISAGTFKGWPNPAPFSAVKRIRFGSNSNLYYRDYSAWEAYKHLRYRYGFDPLASSNGSANFSTNSLKEIGVTGTNLIRPGATVTAGTWVGSFVLPIPIAYNRMGQYGMLVLQQNQTFYNLTMDWGQWALASTATTTSNDLVTGLAGTGLTITPTITMDMGYEYFDLVPNMGTLLSKFMSVNSFTPNTAPINGQNIVQIPQTDDVSMVLLEVINNGSPIDSANFSNIIMGHSGNVYDHQDNIGMKMTRSYWERDGLSPMDGVLDWDFGIRGGQMDRRDTIDNFNDQNITNLQFNYSLPATGLTLTNPTSSCLVEALRPLTQAS